MIGHTRNPSAATITQHTKRISWRMSGLERRCRETAKSILDPLAEMGMVLVARWQLLRANPQWWMDWATSPRNIWRICPRAREFKWPFERSVALWKLNPASEHNLMNVYHDSSPSRFPMAELFCSSTLTLPKAGGNALRIRKVLEDGIFASVPPPKERC